MFFDHDKEKLVLQFGQQPELTGPLYGNQFLDLTFDS